MKKISLFLLFLMALVVMSCSKDETSMSISQESAIEFATYVGRDAQTRASIADLATLQAADVGFGVFAYYTAQDDYATNATKPNFMYNQHVTADSKWGYTPLKYWPNNTGEKVSFFAYAPYSAGAAGNNISDFGPGNSTAGDPMVKFTVNDAVKSQTDLLYADATNLKNLTKQAIGGKVNFPFKHALSRIGFKVQAMVDKVAADGVTSDAIGNNTKIVITKVELIGKFYDSGVLNLNNGATVAPNWGSYLPDALVEKTFTLNANTTTEDSDFTNPETFGPASSSLTVFGQSVTTTAATLNKDDSYIMVIPQNFAAGSEVKIKVTYVVITDDFNLENNISKITNVIESTPFIFDFQHGKAYTFNLTLGMTSVKFDASVTDWSVVTPETVVNVPINTTTP